MVCNIDPRKRSRHGLFAASGSFVFQYFAVATLIYAQFMWLPAANAQEPYRILALHGVWENRTWDTDFDRHLDAHLERSLGAAVELTSMNIGIDQYPLGQVPAPITDMVKFQIEDKRVDMIIAVLPRAIDFYLDIGLSENVHNLFVLPSISQSEIVAANPNIWAIETTATDGIRANFELMLELKPDLSSIEIIGGNGATDRVYLARAQEIVEDFSEQTQFNFHSGLSPQALGELSASLPPSAAILALPHANYGDNQRTNEAVFMPILTANSAVPIFTISDVVLGLGAAGGSISSTDSYAEAAAETIGNIIYQRESYVRASPASNRTILDWSVMQRYGLDASELSFPFTFINRPVRVWEAYPYQSVVFVNLLLLLLLGLFVQQYLLQRSRSSKKKIENSERKAQEIAERYSLLTMNSLDVIWTWDGRSNSLSFCSPSIKKLLDYSPEEFMSMRLDEIMSPESAADAKSRIFNGSKEAQVFEVEMIRRDGSSVWVELAAKHVEVNGNDADEWVGITRDISQRKREEEQKKALETEVRQAQKFESLGTLAGGIAHDFNNILGILIGVTDLLKIELAENKRATELIEKLSRGTSRAHGLVNQILTFSRQSKGEKVIAEVAPIIEETLDLISAGVPNKISIETNLPSQRLNILADPNQVEQVLVNLLTNAYEAIGDSAGVVSISLNEEELPKEREFKHGRLSGGKYAVIQVSDNGPGLDEEAMDRIFDPFYTSKQLGNGMGLAIVHGIILDHEGAIEVSNIETGGLRFTIYLPLRNETTPEVHVPAESRTKMAKSKILILDDQDELLATVKMMLEAMGHQCVACSKPQQALDILAKTHTDLDLVITDYSMPELNGLDIIQHCREHYPDLNIILTTGYSAELQKDDSVDLQDLPHVLQKPFTLESLSQLVEKSLH